MNYDNIERCMQLHERVEIHYYVDHYEAQLWTKDGDWLVVRGSGSSVDLAIRNLDNQLIDKTLDDIRSMEPLT